MEQPSLITGGSSEREREYIRQRYRYKFIPSAVK